MFYQFYFTYPKDAERVRQLMAQRREELIKAHHGEPSVVEPSMDPLAADGSVSVKPII
jgi:hypothetical protein